MPIDYRDYPADWQERRARILKRDNHRCNRCGVPNYSIIQRFDGDRYRLLQVCNSYQEAREEKTAYLTMEPRPVIIILTVMHLDHDEWNHQVEDSRLEAACQRCHLQYDRHDNEMRKRYGRHWRRYQIGIFQPLNQ